MDRDYDGRLTFGEFMGEETPLEKVFKNMDKDGDGTVSKEVREFSRGDCTNNKGQFFFRNLRNFVNI